MKKKRIGIHIVGNFYIYTIYEITDCKGGKFYIGEPRGSVGVTRGATTLAELEKDLDNDLKMLNYISRQRCW